MPGNLASVDVNLPLRNKKRPAPGSTLVRMFQQLLHLALHPNAGMFAFAQAVSWATAALVVASMAYSLLALFASASFRAYTRRRLPVLTAESAPAVSLLKPVKGFDPAMMEAFRSHCRQAYPGRFEILFGASSEDDPAVPAIRQLMAEFEQVPIRLILCPLRLGTNGKLSNLIQMLPHAHHAHLLINDSDILVSPSYLTRVFEQFAIPTRPARPVGMVTALYRGRAHGSLGSILEALGISTDFMSGVLVSRIVERGIHFGLGSTLAVRRDALTSAGGLEALVDHLADDYEMGARIDHAGFEVRLATEVVETSIPAYSLAGYWSHQIRWARTVRDSRKWGYVGLLFTHLLPLALLNVLASGLSLTSLWLLSLAIFLRLGVAMQVGALAVRDHQVLPNLLLLPLRDLAGFAIWIGSFAGNTILWRGEKFILKNGRLFQPGTQQP